MTRAVAWATALLLAAVPALAVETADLMKRRPSPGVIALLAERMAQAPGDSAGPAALERIAAGLLDPSAEVRSAATRVATAGSLGQLAPTLRKALTAEINAAAAREQAMGLLILEGPSAFEAVSEALERFDSFKHDPDFWMVLLSFAIGEETTVPAGVTATLLRRANPVAWVSLLELSRRRRLEIDPEQLAAGLDAQNERIRTSTCYHTAFRLTLGAPEAPRLRAAVEAKLAAAAPAERPIEQLLRDLLRAEMAQEPSPIEKLQSRDWIDEAIQAVGTYPSLPTRQPEKDFYLGTFLKRPAESSPI